MIQVRGDQRADGLGQNIVFDSVRVTSVGIPEPQPRFLVASGSLRPGGAAATDYRTGLCATQGNQVVTVSTRGSAGQFCITRSRRNSCLMGSLEVALTVVVAPSGLGAISTVGPPGGLSAPYHSTKLGDH